MNKVYDHKAAALNALRKQTKPSDIEKQINDCLKVAGVTFSASCLGVTEALDSEMFEYRVTLKNEGTKKAFTLPFYKGLGHCLKYRAFGSLEKLVIPANATEVLYALLNDAQACEYSFDEWCDSYGYDTDSRKALDTYLKCQESDKHLRSVIPAKQLEQLQALLEDY